MEWKKKNINETRVKNEDKNLMWKKKRWGDFQVSEVKEKVFMGDDRIACLISVILWTGLLSSN